MVNTTSLSQSSPPSWTGSCEQRSGPISAFPPEMSLSVISRNPLRLEPSTVATVLGRPIPRYDVPAADSGAIGTVIVVCFNNLAFSRMALESILANSDFLPYELFIVDNASTDGTAEYLEKLAASYPHVRVLHSDVNEGFAAANNRALEQARGEFVVLINNDTIAPRGWLQGLLQHAQDPDVGLVGPSTNRIGNEAEIETTYRTYDEFERFAACAMHRERGRRFDIRTAAMFCVAFRRTTFQRIGPLDERFGLGMFEDDDYSMRVREAGLRVICTDAVFIHHFGKASFGDLAQGTYGRLFHRNRRRFERKWARNWQPHQRRPCNSYEAAVRRIQEAANRVLPVACNVLVATRGDDRLLQLKGRTCRHFPQGPDGNFAGYHPPDGEWAISELQRLCRGGAKYLVLPAAMQWWLDHYTVLRDYFDSDCHVVWSDRDCTIYQLSPDLLSPKPSRSLTGRGR